MQIGDPDGWATIVSALKPLQALRFLGLNYEDYYQESDGIPAAALAATLGELTRLQHLELEGNNFGANVSDGAGLAEAIKKLISLQHLDISRCNLKDICPDYARALKSLAGLKFLSLARNGLGESGARSFAAGLEQLTAIQTLDLSGNELGDRGIKALEPTLRKLTVLQDFPLDVRGNMLSLEGVAALAPMFKRVKILELDLCGIEIAARKASALERVLQHMSGLQRLTLSRNGLDDVSLAALISGLKHLKALKSLDLGDNVIGDEGAKALGPVLEQMKALQSFEIKDDGYKRQLSIEGIAALAPTYKRFNKKSLDLKGVKVGAQGAAALERVLQHLDGLQGLSMSGNDLEDLLMMQHSRRSSLV